MSIKKIKSILITTILLASLMPLFSEAKTSVDIPEIYFFWDKGCPYCEQQKVFFEELKEEYPEIKINDYFIGSKDGLKLFTELIEKHPGSEKYFGVVPVTFFDGEYFVGLNKEKIKDLVKERLELIIENEKKEKEENLLTDSAFSLPILKGINFENWSLGALAMVIGAVDGFNICSLGALILILVLVISLKSKKATIILGSAFIIITVITYSTFVFLWHQLFSFIVPFIKIAKLIIGIAALFGGFYFIKQLFKFRKNEAVCENSDNKIIAKATKRIEKIFEERKNLWTLLVGVIIFAILVTIIEFPCSAVFPIIFTGILAQAKLPFLTSAFYIFVYLFFYMLDEMIIFLVAVLTKNIWIASKKFMTAMSFVGALVLFFLAYQYLLVG